jgi:hypothetical protein
MAKTLTLPKILSLPILLRSNQPRKVIEDCLIKLLKKRLKELKIVWNASAFRGGLSNPNLPTRLLEKLENLLAVAEASGWKISGELKIELDETIEDIESFNPPFRKSIKKIQGNLKAGRLKISSLEKASKELGIK